MVDVGGGDGTLLAAVLRAHPGSRGVLFDSTAGLAQAPDVLAEADVTERCEVVAGDFFTGVPEGELHLLKSIVHDWDDDRVVTILGHCCQALPEHGRVLIIEPVLSEVVEPGAPGLSYLSALRRPPSPPDPSNTMTSPAQSLPLALLVDTPHRRSRVINCYDRLGSSRAVGTRVDASDI